MAESQVPRLSEKKPASGGYMRYDSIYMTLWKRQNYRDKNTDGWFSGTGPRVNDKEHWSILGGDKTVLYLNCDGCIHLLKLIELYFKMDELYYMYIIL